MYLAIFALEVKIKSFIYDNSYFHIPQHLWNVETSKI